MKTLLMCMSIIITLATSLPTSASDLAKLYPEKLAQAKDLYPLAKAFFTGPGSLEPGETLTPEMVKSPQRQAAYYKFRRLLGLAIDAEYDISYLEQFGLVKAKRGYYVDFSKYPQWATVRSLFLDLRTVNSLRSIENQLLRLGLSASDIKKIEIYLTKHHPQIVENLSRQKLLQPHLKAFQQKQLLHPLNESELNVVVNIHEQLKHHRFDSWNKWAVNLLEQLPKSKQRILISFLQQNLGSMAIGRAPISEAYLNTFAKELATGKTQENLTASLKEIKRRIAKEMRQ